MADEKLPGVVPCLCVVVFFFDIMVILGNRPNILLAANWQHVSKPKANIMGEVEHYLQTYTLLHRQTSKMSYTRLRL